MDFPQWNWVVTIFFSMGFLMGFQGVEYLQFIFIRVGPFGDGLVPPYEELAVGGDEGGDQLFGGGLGYKREVLKDLKVLTLLGNKVGTFEIRYVLLLYPVIRVERPYAEARQQLLHVVFLVEGVEREEALQVGAGT